jgi:hypothetical protein
MGRALGIADGQLYYSSGSGTAGIYALGTGLPTSGSFTGALIAASASPYAFLFADLSSSVAGVDTLYVADDASTGNGGGIPKYSKQGNGSWSFNSVLAGTGPVRGLTGVVSGGAVQLYATSDTKLYAALDDSGYAGSIAGAGAVTLASAAANTVFRGVAMTPVPEPDGRAIALTSISVLGLFASRRKRA